MGRRNIACAASTLFAKPLLGPVIQVAGTLSGLCVTRLANYHKIGNLYWHFLTQTPTLWMFLATSHMLVDPVHIFHQGFSLGPVDLDHATSRTPIGAGNHLNDISRANQHRSFTTLPFLVLSTDLLMTRYSCEQEPIQGN